MCTNVSFNSATNRINAPGYAYDAAGNLTQDPTWIPTANYTWDAEGRLVTITQGASTYANNTYKAQGWAVQTVWPIYGNMVQDNLYDLDGRELGWLAQTLLFRSAPRRGIQASRSIGRIGSSPRK